MPLTQAQILAMQSGVAQAVANNPKNLGSTVVNDPIVTVGNTSVPSSWVNPNPNPLPPRPEAVITDEPTSGGTSVVVEPNLGTPTGGIVEPEVLTSSGTSTNTTTTGSGGGGGGGFMGGGGGGGGATDTATDGGVSTPVKPNYILYVGILLAVIVVYKVFSKQTPTT